MSSNGVRSNGGPGSSVQSEGSGSLATEGAGQVGGVAAEPWHLPPVVRTLTMSLTGSDAPRITSTTLRRPFHRGQEATCRGLKQLESAGLVVPGQSHVVTVVEGIGNTSRNSRTRRIGGGR
jgi:hypothetical protein